MQSFLAKQSVHDLAKTVVHLGDLHQVAGLGDGDGIDPVIGAPKALRRHRLHGGHSRGEGNEPGGVAGHLLVGKQHRGVAGERGAERLAEGSIEGLERIGEVLGFGLDLTREYHLEMGGLNPVPLHLRGILRAEHGGQTAHQQGGIFHWRAPCGNFEAMRLIDSFQQITAAKCEP